ncbi:hypothetical protein H5410_055403 [Solanum commersonii]|uniref:Uncharacterized protein n=1 Tax=Solanum commersonii TaxID=4109 RepID=A0A9J5WIL0_SOLCO|nr:hypothetical protein H5410_055403 [Solanum commersonii]
MSSPTASQPFPVADLLTSTSEFSSLLSKALVGTKLLNPCLPKEFSFAESLNQLAQQSHYSLIRDITLVEGIPQIKWTEEEVDKMNQIEELQFALVGKFTHEWKDLEECRMRKIPQPRDVENFQHDRGDGINNSDPWFVPAKLRYVHGFQKGKARVLSSGRVVGDPGQWDVVKDLRPSEYQLHITVKNKFDALTQNV